MMRTNGEIERDANIAKSLRRIADALDAIHGTLAEAMRPDVEVEEDDDDPE